MLQNYHLNIEDQTISKILVLRSPDTYLRMLFETLVIVFTVYTIEISEKLSLSVYFCIEESF